MKKHTLLLACAMRILLNLIALPPKGEARRYVANDFLNLIAFPAWGRETAIAALGYWRYPHTGVDFSLFSH